MSSETHSQTISRGLRRDEYHIERFRYEPGESTPISGRIPPDLRTRLAGSSRESAGDSELRRRLEQARSEGHQQGLAEGAQIHADAMRREQLAIARAIEEFAQDRFRYFRRVEKEVVELAMSIAKRILHRESQLDPLMLQGAVRAVLDRVADSTGSAMRVHPSRLAAWEEWFARHSALQRPRLAADPALAVDQCVLETSMGTTDIGVDSQLQEIESGFCDLLATRSASEPRP